MSGGDGGGGGDTKVPMVPRQQLHEDTNDHVILNTDFDNRSQAQPQRGPPPQARERQTSAQENGGGGGGGGCIGRRR